MYEIDGNEINIKKDNTVKKLCYYCVLGVSKRKVIYGSSPDIVYRKCVRLHEKGEVSFEPFPTIPRLRKNTEDIPF